MSDSRLQSEREYNDSLAPLFGLPIYNEAGTGIVGYTQPSINVEELTGLILAQFPIPESTKPMPKEGAYTILACGNRHALVGTEEGSIEVWPVATLNGPRGFKEPSPAFSTQHHFVRSASMEGAAVTVEDSIILNWYVQAFGGEILECECAFDVVASVWFVKR